MAVAMLNGNSKENSIMEQILHVKVPYRKVTLKHYLDPYRDLVRLLPITIEKEKNLRIHTHTLIKQVAM